MIGGVALIARGVQRATEDLPFALDEASPEVDSISLWIQTWIHWIFSARWLAKEGLNMSMLHHHRLRSRVVKCLCSVLTASRRRSELLAVLKTF